MSLISPIGQRIRADALRTKILMASALCSLAEDQMEDGAVQSAVDCLATAHVRVDSISRRLANPDETSVSVALELSVMIQQLRERMQRIDAAIR